MDARACAGPRSRRCAGWVSMPRFRRALVGRPRQLVRRRARSCCAAIGAGLCVAGSAVRAAAGAQMLNADRRTRHPYRHMLHACGRRRRRPHGADGIRIRRRATIWMRAKRRQRLRSWRIRQTPWTLIRSDISDANALSEASRGTRHRRRDAHAYRSGRADERPCRSDTPRRSADAKAPDRGDDQSDCSTNSRHAWSAARSAAARGRRKHSWPTK